MPQLADCMRPELVVVAPEDSLGEVAERLMEVSMGAAVVKDFGRLVGIITERDLLKAMAERVHASEARVRTWMTPDPVTATADTECDEAARLMLDGGFRHLPVLDEAGQVVGVVSVRRVLAAAQAAARPA